jgi:hypothetical protein
VGRGLGLGLGEESDGAGNSRAGARLLVEEGDDPDRWGPPVSGREREGRYPFGRGFLGRGPVSSLGRKGYPGPFHSFFFIFFLFFLFFFCFLISFITFAFWLQFDSNQNLKFSNIQNNILKQ